MIYLLLADGFEEIEALTPVDILRRVGCEVETVGITGKVVVGAHGIPVTADILPREMGACDMLILPGGMPGSKHLDNWAGMDDTLSRVLAHGGRVAAICAAPMILGKRHLLKGRRAVCFPGFEDTLIEAIPSQERVVTDGPFTTAIGMGAALEFACELVSLLLGKERAETIYKQTLGR